MAITRVGGSWIHKYVSLVADDVTHTYTRAAKPELNLPNGSRCFEMDSDTEYIYDRENDAWEVYVPSSGEGSGGTTDYTQLTNKPSINNVQLSGNKSLADLGAVGDVQINGTSILSNGIANVPVAGSSQLGVVMSDADYGTEIASNRVRIVKAADNQVQAGTHTNRPITPSNQDKAAFYGLAKAAGDTTMPSSSNAVGTYTEEAKTAIRAMLGVTDSAGGMNVVTLTGTNVTQTAAENTMYKCGELAELTFTAPASGITAVRFSSGSTPTVASFPGVTWLGDFDPDNLIANVTYEINIFDGVGVAGWA